MFSRMRWNRAGGELRVVHGVDLGLVAAEQLAEKIAVVAPVAVQGEVLDAQAHAVGRERDGIGGLIGGVILTWRLVVAVWYIPLTIYRLLTN